MTLTEFVSSYRRCGVNNVPAEHVSEILDTVRLDPGAHSRAKHLKDLADRRSFYAVCLRFQNGRWTNWMSDGVYRVASHFNLDATIAFDELDSESEDIDLSMLLELC